MNAYQAWQSAFVFWSTMAQAPGVIAMRLMAPPRARPVLHRPAGPTVPAEPLAAVEETVTEVAAIPVPENVPAPEVVSREVQAHTVPHGAFVEVSAPALAAATAEEPEAAPKPAPEREPLRFPTGPSAVEPSAPLAILAESEPESLVEAAVRPLVASSERPLAEAAVGDAVSMPSQAGPRAPSATRKGRPRRGV